MDLGFGMVRHWWRPLMRAWLTGVLPVIVVVSLLCWELPALAIAIVWWLKPMFDRIPLFILSRAAFGHVPSGRETARAVLGVWRRSLLWDLTLGRFDPARSFNMPVRDLEGLSGKARRQRLGVLQKQTRGRAIWLTVICIHFELVLNFSLIALMYLLLPNTVQDDFFANVMANDQGAGFSLLMNSTYWAVMLVIEPFYVAAGFSLYLNRRTVLEGWDVEIAFRRLAQRALALKDRAAGVVGAVVLVAVIATLGLHAPPATAEQTPNAVADETITLARAPLKARIAEILEQPDLRTKESKLQWKYVGKRSDQSDKTPDWAWLKSLRDWMPGVALFLEGLLWVVVALAVIWLVVNRKRWLGLLGYRGASEPIVPAKTLFGLDIQPQSLPDEVATEAWRLWQSGQPRAALSLLYRGALADWVTHRHIEVGVHATEGECLRLCRAVASPETGHYFSQLTRAWQHTAYAGRHPSADDMQQLCRQWDAHFRRAS
ncbi:MAG: DUF4129 domain-containing protein [Thiobacillus sp.]|nr:DUF4129 domain-containing protein [Thiobacillus sp.]